MVINGKTRGERREERIKHYFGDFQNLNTKKKRNEMYKRVNKMKKEAKDGYQNEIGAELQRLTAELQRLTAELQELGAED